MAESPDYSSLVAQAEKAVQSVKDAELRRIAFQKVLEDLLTGGAQAKSPPASKRQAREHAPRKSAKASAGGPRGYLREMHDEGFFKKPKTITEVKVELENRGHHIPMSSLSGPLQAFCKQKLLRRQKTEKGNKKTFAYSNW